ncbi:MULTISPECIES: hypothetical protein [Sphingobacterium]|uniref:hypothetical protein n=1 Tax=Sphingobacterium TaxID=28453 RepID=UPI0009651016|nr:MULTISPECIES: hypothetical protein [Sphingobacterium]OJZ05736.1 MAG: hypothetical protein BGP15_01070 [Sphingobacterium sp. 40-24]
MKENLDEFGLAAKVATLLALPRVDRALALQLMRDNFVDWMEHNFNLGSNQADKLNQLPAELSQKLGIAISNYLMEDQVLQVRKDEKKDEDPDFTELCIYGVDEWLDGGAKAEATPLYIRISYRNA